MMQTVTALSPTLFTAPFSAKGVVSTTLTPEQTTTPPPAVDRFEKSKAITPPLATSVRAGAIDLFKSDGTTSLVVESLRDLPFESLIECTRRAVKVLTDPKRLNHADQALKDLPIIQQRVSENSNYIPTQQEADSIIRANAQYMKEREKRS